MSAHLRGGQPAELFGSPYISRQANHFLAQPLMCAGGDREHVSASPVPRVDAVAIAELADGDDARGDRAARLHRRLRAIQGHEAMQLIPPAAGEAAVATAWTAAADVLFEQDDAQVRVSLGQEIGGP